MRLFINLEALKRASVTHRPPSSGTEYRIPIRRRLQGWLRSCWRVLTRLFLLVLVRRLQRRWISFHLLHALGSGAWMHLETLNCGKHLSCAGSSYKRRFSSLETATRQSSAVHTPTTAGRRSASKSWLPYYIPDPTSWAARLAQIPPSVNSVCSANLNLHPHSNFAGIPGRIDINAGWRQLTTTEPNLEYFLCTVGLCRRRRAAGRVKYRSFPSPPGLVQRIPYATERPY